jgi:hypothetical protein
MVGKPEKKQSELECLNEADGPRDTHGEEQVRVDDTFN